jgi:hypothetical protein
VDEWDEFGEVPRPLAAIERGDLADALRGFAMRHLLDYRRPGVSSDVDVCGFGVALWLIGDTHGATGVWSRVCEEAARGRYSYSSTGTFQGGLLLWFASVWLADESARAPAVELFNKLLRRQWPGLGDAGFPALLARPLLGQVDLPQVQAAFSDHPQAREGEEWMALFYAGVRAHQEGDQAATRRLWTQAREQSEPEVEFECYLLMHEREKLTA